MLTRPSNHPGGYFGTIYGAAAMKLIVVAVVNATRPPPSAPEAMDATAVVYCLTMVDKRTQKYYSK